MVEDAAKKWRGYALGLGAVAMVATVAAGYFYYQLQQYHIEAQEFAVYQQEKLEQRQQLQRLMDRNEIMLRDIVEITALEKKLRQTLLRDMDGSTFHLSPGLGQSQLKPHYQGGGKSNLTIKEELELVDRQSQNIEAMLEPTKASVGRLLEILAGHQQGCMEYFPDMVPVENGIISSQYGVRIEPIGGDAQWHNGLDIAADFGEPVLASAAGTVERAGFNGGYGRYVRLSHGNGYETAYGHMSSLVVRKGQQVQKGQIIGFVGSSGYSTGPHVHFEVIVDRQFMNPRYFLKNK